MPVIPIPSSFPTNIPSVAVPGEIAGGSCELVEKDDGMGITGIAPQADVGTGFGDAAGIARVRNGGGLGRQANFTHLLEEQYSNPTYAPCNAPASSDVCVAGEF